LKSTETISYAARMNNPNNFSNFGSLKSTETYFSKRTFVRLRGFQQFRLVEEH